MEISISMAIASIAAWFTPAVLFCAANLIIAIIFIASNTTNKHPQDHNNAHPEMSRVSSFLHRTTSIKLPSYASTTNVEPKTATYSSSSRLDQSIHLSSEQTSDSPGQLVRTPSFLDRLKSFKMISSNQLETIDSDPSHDHAHNVSRSKSEKTTSKKALVEMKKSRSEVRIASNDNDNVGVQRPATARDEEVDARADDFISRFKQQLRLQRMESLVRYNEMVNRRR